MKKIAIIAAMSKEINLIKDLLDNVKEVEKNGIKFITGDLSNKEIILMESGIGKVCAAVKTTELVKEFAPDCVINSGVAGGIGDMVKVMDIVVGSETVYNDVWCLDPNSYGQVQGFPARFGADEKLLDKVKTGDNDGIMVHKGLICSGDKFIASADEAMSIRDKFADGMAVDMESCAVAQACHMLKTPFISFRIISDTPIRRENSFDEYKDFWKMMSDKSFALVRKFIENI